MRHCYVLSVFTRGEEGGNPLGVVTDVSGLSPKTMQQVATDLGFSETIYVDWRAGGIPLVRIFTPAAEVPFAGHPLVGAAWVLGRLGPGGPGALRCQIGEMPYRIDGEISAVMCPGDQPVTGGPSPEPGIVSDYTVEMPLPYRLLQLETPAAVAAFDSVGLEGETYVWAWESDGHGVRARFFAAGLGVPEDPATGSAAVALAAALGAMGMQNGAIEVRQGDEVGAPSTIRLSWDSEGVTISGRVSRIETRELAV